MCLNYETSKMIPKGFEAKLEGDTTNNGKFAKAAPATSSSRQWSGFRNPRIVRVSRAFGGKDRHSKVCTIRGLRDRRIRLSVPTAIQLYDLQDRLELNQPSKVIDWLLDATKQDIDKLPPLQMLPGFGQFHQQMLLSHHEPSFNYATSPSPLPPFFGANVEAEDVAAVRARSKEVEKGKWIKGTEKETIGDFYSGQNSSAGHRFFPVAAANNTSYSSMLPSNSMQLNSSYHNLEPSSTTLSLSQFGGQGFLPQVHENYLNHPQGATAPSSIALPSAGPHQFLFCAPSSMPPLFPMFNSNSQQYFLPNSIPSITNNSFPFRTFSSNGNQGPEQGDNRNS